MRANLLRTLLSNKSNRWEWYPLALSNYQKPFWNWSEEHDETIIVAIKHYKRSLIVNQKWRQVLQVKCPPRPDKVCPKQYILKSYQSKLISLCLIFTGRFYAPMEIVWSKHWIKLKPIRWSHLVFWFIRWRLSGTITISWIKTSCQIIPVGYKQEPKLGFARYMYCCIVLFH